MRGAFKYIVSAMAVVMPAIAAQNLFDEAEDLLVPFLKRDELTVQQIEGIIEQVNSSGLIFSALNGLADDEDLQNNLVNTAVGFLENGTNPLAGYNITLNTTGILDQVIASGLINSTLDTLLKNDQNRNKLASKVGQFLSTHVWVSKVLRDIANGHKLSAKWIADTQKNFKPHVRGDNSGKQAVLKALFDEADSSDDSSDQYAGLAQRFFNNFINAALGSSLVNDLLNDILTALNNTGIVPSIVLQVLDQPKILKMAGSLIGKFYDTGVLDNVNLQYYFEEAKKKGYLAKGVELVFTDPNYSPYVAKLFETMDNNDVFKNIQFGLYGSGSGGYNDGSGN